jgi:hypothetical protein
MIKACLKMFCVLALLALPANVAAADHMEQALATRDAYQELFSKINGFNGIGITGCDPVTGAIDIVSPNFVGCILVFIETPAAYYAARSVFSTPFILNDIWVNFEVISAIDAYPGVTVRN